MKANNFLKQMMGDSMAQEIDLKEQTLKKLDQLIQDYYGYTSSFDKYNLMILAEDCIKLINKL